MTVAESIERAGFVPVARCRRENGSYRKGYLIRCDSCSPVSINGHVAHERGCWREPVACRFCGLSYQRADGHDCEEV